MIMGLMMRQAITTGKKALPVQTTSPHIPVRIRRISALREGTRIRKRGVCLGTDPNADLIYLSPKHLRTHLHILGPTGQGKSRLLLWLFQLLCHTGRPLILIDPKGDLYRQARDWAILYGFQKRLVLFDLSGNILPGYNPLRQNGLRIDLQAQWVRNAVMAAWNSAGSFETTPLLVRMLYLCLYVARALEVSLLEALDVLRPSPVLRHRALAQIRDPFVHNALLAFDNLNDRLKAEQSNSTISRLEMFLCDEIVRKVLCSPISIDTEQVLADRKIWLINAAKCQPVLGDQIKLLLRFISNDILAHVYKGHGEGRYNEHNPVYYIADEFQNAATAEWATALDEGRGLGLVSILAHQHLSQLADEDKSGYLLKSCMNDARTKILFGGLDYQDIEPFANNLLLRHFDPLAIKHIQRNPVFVPVLDWLAVPTESVSTAFSRSISDSITDADSISHSVQFSQTLGRSAANSRAVSEGTNESYSYGRNSTTSESDSWGTSDSVSGAHTTGTAESRGHTQGRGTSTGTSDSISANNAAGWSEDAGRSNGTNASDGQQMLPPRNVLLSSRGELVGISANTGTTDGRSVSAGRNGMVGSSAGHAKSQVHSSNDAINTNISKSSADMHGWSHGVQEGHSITRSEGESETWMHGTNRSVTDGMTETNSTAVSAGNSNTVGKTFSRGKSVTQGETTTQGASVTLSPFYKYIREDIETPVFYTPEEQKLLIMQRLARIPPMFFHVQPPEGADCILRAPLVDDPTTMITERRRAAGLQVVHAALPCYINIAEPRRAEIGSHTAQGADDVIDVEVVHGATSPDTLAALPSPVAPDAATEEALWERVREMSRRYGKK
jgi:hypothetical protein